MRLPGQTALISRRALHPLILTTTSHTTHMMVNTQSNNLLTKRPPFTMSEVYTNQSTAYHHPLQPADTALQQLAPTRTPLVEALGPEILGIVHGFDFSEVNPLCLYIQRPNSTPPPILQSNLRLPD